MPELRVTKEFSFEMAHALKNYSGKCENIHGHSYHLAVSVKGPVLVDENAPKDGMVIDFGDLKRIVQEEILDVFDHALVMHVADERSQSFGQAGTRMILTPFQPTCENLLVDFVSRIKAALQGDVRLVRMKLRETPASFAEWLAEDNR